MCGINGFNFPDDNLIREMNTRVKHRGPDGDGVFVDEHVSLGHTRLAILDLTPAGAQPMKSDDESVVIVFNGEIYNFQELRNDLEKKGHHFRSKSDTEVILRAYEDEGIGCVKKLNGIFAFALYDKKRQALYLVRDHVGVKPLYYYWNHQKLIFSSEIKAILAHNVPRTLNLDALNIYFRMLYVPAPMTMFQEIQKVEPGTYVVYEHGVLSTERYWQPGTSPLIRDKRYAREEIQRLMRDSVKRQLISERPVGVFLSGGIDSTVILGLAKEALGAPPKTFSVGFDVVPEKFNADLRLAKQTSEHFGSDHHELIVTGDDCLRVLPEVIEQMDEPVANGTQVATYLLSKFARADIVVALGGDGGDELFGGYERYRLSRLVSMYQKFPAFTRRMISSMADTLPPNFAAEVKKLEDPPGVGRYLSYMAQKEDDIRRVLAAGVNRPPVVRTWYDRYFDPSEKDTENAMMWADVRSWLPDESLVRSDKLSMAFALEQRVPILDHRLVELSRRIPSAWKLQGGTKSLFRDALRQYIPAHVLNQPKRGWMTPSSNWLRNALLPLAREVLSPSYNSATAEILNFDGLQQMLELHVSAKEYHLHPLWAALTFQMWYKKFMH